jgi:hypothetical protein
VTQGHDPEILPPPESGTEALLEYSWASICDRRLFKLIIDLALQRDFGAHIARQALDGKVIDRAQKPADLAATNPGPATRALRQLRQELLEMLVSRAVDNFQVYLVSAVRIVLRKEPRILSDRKQELTLGHILKFESIEALSREIIEAKLNALSYEGFGELKAWCAQRSIPLLVPHGQDDRVVELIALRNIIIHNRGCVDERYRAAVPSSTVRLGDKRKIGVDDLFGAIALLDDVVRMTDVAVTGKFRLETVNVRGDIKDRIKQRYSNLSNDAPSPA